MAPIPIGRKIALSALTGAIFYGVVLAVIVKDVAGPAAARIALWNVVLVDQFMGRGQSGPVFDGHASFPGAGWPGLLSGFIIYPMIFFGAFTLRSRLKRV